MKVGGVPFDQGKHSRGSLRPTAIVVHRTYGKWAGDYNIGKNGRRNGKTIEPIGFHFLIGKNEGEWVQFYDTAVKCNHAAGANSWAVGIEISGRNEDSLTDWQVRALRWITQAIANHHGISTDYVSTGIRRRLYCVQPHSLVPGSTHTDYVKPEDWKRVYPPAPAVQLPNRPALTAGSKGRLVEILRWELALITGRGAEMNLDGEIFGMHMLHVLQDLDRMLPNEDWGDSTTVTPHMWNVIDFLVLYNGHQLVLS